MIVGLRWGVLVLGVALGVGIGAVDGSAIEPGWLELLTVAACVGGLLVMGALGRWRALPAFAIPYATYVLIEHAIVWNDDPNLYGLDDSGPAVGLIVVLPPALLAIALGIIGRAMLKHRSRRSTALPSA